MTTRFFSKTSLRYFDSLMPTNNLQTFRKVIGADKTRQNRQENIIGIPTKKQQPASQKINNNM